MCFRHVRKKKWKNTTEKSKCIVIKKRVCCSIFHSSFFSSLCPLRTDKFAEFASICPWLPKRFSSSPFRWNLTLSHTTSSKFQNLKSDSAPAHSCRLETTGIQRNDPACVSLCGCDRRAKEHGWPRNKVAEEVVWRRRRDHLRGGVVETFVGF